MLTSSISNTSRCHSVGVSCNFSGHCWFGMYWQVLLSIDVYYVWRMADVVANLVFVADVLATVVHVWWNWHEARCYGQCTNSVQKNCRTLQHCDTYWCLKCLRLTFSSDLEEAMFDTGKSLSPNKFKFCFWEKHKVYIKLQPNEYIISYYAKALFTSVPIEPAIEIIRKHLEDDKDLQQRTSMIVNHNICLLEFCLKNTCFIFQGRYYEQVEGAVMGSPISPIVANLYIEAFEVKSLNTAPHPPSLWRRFVDDTFVVI